MNVSEIRCICEELQFPREAQAALAAACFDVVDSVFSTERDDRWRIFQVSPDMALADYPEDTALQRSLKKWLLAGNTMGCGEGIFFLKNGEVLPH